jgi:hypothetical protein
MGGCQNASNGRNVGRVAGVGVVCSVGHIRIGHSLDQEQEEK